MISVSSAAFSPDGKRVVTASPDTTARVWDAESATRNRNPQRPRWKCLFGRLQCGRQVCRHRLRRQDRAHLGRRDRARNCDSSKAMMTLLTQPTSAQTPSASSPPPGIRPRASRTRNPGAKSRPSEAMIIPWCRPPSAGTVSASSPLRGTRPHRLRRRDQVRIAIEVMRTAASAAACGGQRFVTASRDKTARIWDAVTGREIAPPLKGHDGYVTVAAFSPDGKRVVTASAANTARIWDAETGVRNRKPKWLRWKSSFGRLQSTASASSPPPTTRPRASGTPRPG